MAGPFFRAVLPQPLPSLLTFHLLSQFPELEHGISTRHSEKRQQHDVTVRQVHGTNFVWVKRRGRQEKRHEADCILTALSNMTLKIGTSDCVPMVVYDQRHKRGGVLHAGVRGTTQGILLNVLKQFKPHDIYLGIGPAIGVECYDNIDLQMENVLQAKSAGIPLNHIEVMRWCTKCHSDIFFSYRAGDTQNFGTYFRILAKSANF